MISGFFQGISPLLPVIIIILIGILSLFISWWSYVHLTSLKPVKKWSLISLRGSALFILVLLLLNPFLTDQFTISEKPSVAVYLDNSQSMSIERGDYNGAESFDEIISEFEETRTNDFDYTYYFFDSEIRENVDHNLSGTSTNLQRVIEHIREFESVYSASILFSDGIITQGRDPVFTAQRLNSPIITVPVGDTSQVRDIAISEIDFNTPVYTNSEHLFSTELQQEGYEGETVPVRFLIDGELIETQNIDFTATATTHRVEFTHQFSDPGFYEIEISTPVLPDELTGQNNRSAATAEVLEDKTQILSLAFEIHPDVSSIRRIIATDQQNELFSSTVLSENRLIGENPMQMDEDFDLIVLHGLPAQNSELQTWLSENRTPVLFVSTPGSYEYLTNTNFLDVVGFAISGQQNILPVQFEAFSDRRIHPVLELDVPGVQRFPALRSSMSTYTVSPLAEILLTAEYQRTPTDIPLLIVEDASERRIASVNAFNWYLYEQNNNDEVRKFYRDLFTNLLSWTSTTPDRRTLTINPAKESFTENEPVQLRATLYNERGEPEPEAFIEVRITDESSADESSVYRMNHNRNENYSAEVGNYPEGIYIAEATATKNNRTIGTDETRIRVSTSTAEFLNTKRDDDLLRQIALLTDGIFLESKNFGEVNEFLEEGDYGTIQEQVSTDYMYINEYGWFWFSIILILLSSEWLLRRSASLP